MDVYCASARKCTQRVHPRRASPASPAKVREIDHLSSIPAQIAITHHGPGEQAVGNQTNGGGTEQPRAERLFHKSRKCLCHAARVIGIEIHGRLHEKQADKCDQQSPRAKAHPAESYHRNLLPSTLSITPSLDRTILAAMHA